MKFVRLATLALALTISISSGLAQSATDLDQLKTDVQAIKDSQAAIQKDLAEIRKLLAGQQRPAAALPAAVNVDGEPAKGDASARVALIEYSDYQCPFCARFTTDTFPGIETEYIKSGKIRYYFRDLPLSFHKQAFKAAEATHCAGEQGRFWEMHEHLFKNQKELEPAQLVKHAEALRLNVPSFQLCLESGKFAEGIRKDMTDASSAGISGTPSFLIGVIEPNSSTVKVVKKLVGAKSFEDFKTELDSLLITRSATK